MCVSSADKMYQRRRKFIHDGFSIEEIAELEGVSPTAIRSWCRKYDVKYHRWQNKYDVAARPEHERILLRMFFTDLIKVTDTLREGQSMDILNFIKAWRSNYIKIRQTDW